MAAQAGMTVSVDMSEKLEQLRVLVKQVVASSMFCSTWVTPAAETDNGKDIRVYTRSIASMQTTPCL